MEDEATPEELRGALERARADARRLAERLGALNDVSRDFAEATTDYARLLDTVARRASELLESPCVVRLVSEDGLWLPLAAMHYADEGFMARAREAVRGAPTRVDEGFSGAIVRDGALLIPEVSRERMREGVKAEHRAFFEAFPFYSLVGAPLRSQGRAIGLLMLGRHVPGRPFTPDDLAFLQDLADRAALAIANARLIEALRREREATERRVVERTAELARSNRELEEFASVASHDLQEPLRKIHAFGELLEEALGPGAPPEALEHLARVRSAAGRMGGLIRDLLALSRVTRGAREFAPVDLGRVAREVLDDLEARVRETGAAVTVGALPTLDADPVQMRQLFQNLLGNALKFRRAGVAPEVSVTADGGDPCAIRFADNGVGFDERHLGRLFRPFHRLHGAVEYEGSGVGLAICRRIAERHGGGIRARGAPGAGATFVVTLPRSHG